jgi:hypothetical protein
VLTEYTSSYSYPLFANSTAVQLANGSTSFTAVLNRQKIVEVTRPSIYPSGLQPFAALPASSDLVLTLAGTTYTNTQNGSAVLFLVPNDVGSSFSFGNTNQTVRFGGKSAQGELGMEPEIELYFRSVGALNGTLRTDIERLVGKGVVRNEAGVGATNASVSAAVNEGMEAVVGRMQMGLFPTMVLPGE